MDNNPVCSHKLRQRNIVLQLIKLRSQIIYSLNNRYILCPIAFAYYLAMRNHRSL